jgi:hypothetical protein
MTLDSRILDMVTNPTPYINHHVGSRTINTDTTSRRSWTGEEEEEDWEGEGREETGCYPSCMST